MSLTSDFAKNHSGSVPWTKMQSMQPFLRKWGCVSKITQVWNMLRIGFGKKKNLLNFRMF